MSRGWTPIEEDPRWEEEGYFNQVKARCDALAKWWSQLQTESEQEGWRRQRQWEDGGYDPGIEYPRRRDFRRWDEEPGLTKARQQAIEEWE